MRPLSKNLAKVWQAPHKGLVQGGQIFHTYSPSGYCLLDGKQVPNYCYPTYEAGVEEGECHDLPCWSRQVRGGKRRSYYRRHHSLQGRCKGVDGGVGNA